MKYLASYVLVFSFFLLTQSDVKGQRIMTLQQCVDLAYERSLDLENADLNLETAQINETQAKHSRYPALNGSTSYGWNFGRAIDPTTNVFDNQASTYQTFGINAGVSIFQGGVINNSIKQAELSSLSSLRRKDALLDNIGLQVAQNYLNALLADEAESLARYQIELTESQLERIDKLIAAGSLPANDRLELEAQLVRDEQQIIAAENNYILAILNLKNILRLDFEESIQLQKIDPNLIPIDDSILQLSFGEVYAIALGYQPSIKADSIDLKIAELDKKINKGRLLPTIRLGGSLTSNYSNLAKQLSSETEVFNDIPVKINGMDVTVGFPGVDRTFSNTPYTDQLNNNLGYGAGITLSLPIYNNYSAQLNVERSEVSIKQRRIQNEINKQNLKSTIQSALAQARAAKQVYLASMKSLTAQQASLANLEKKLAAGSANNFDFINAKSNLNITENGLLQSRYDYIFKLKVIDYYLGKPLKL